MRFPRGLTIGSVVLAGYVLLAIVQSWPLPVHLATHLTGPPGGDTGVYVWNTWVFRRELIDVGQLPYITNAIFWSGLPANLSLHNYTPFADIVAMLLQPVAGIVAAFNLVYLLNATLAGCGLYLLARRYTVDRAVAWLAGVVFMLSPFLVTRSTGHFSLAAAAPLPFFVWQVLRTRDRPTAWRGCLTGVIGAWAGLTDPYYLIYCTLLGTGVAAAHIWRLDRGPVDAAGTSRLTTWDLGLIVAAIGVAALALWPGRRLSVGPIAVSMTTLYTPVLVVTSLIGARVAARWRPVLTLRAWPTSREWRAAGIASVSALVLLAPWGMALLERMRAGTMVKAPVLWRSSTPGVDLLGLLIPNPNHPLMPEAIRAAIAAGPGGYIEQVAALPLVAVLIIVLAWRRGFRPSAAWLAVTIGFSVLALGPFVHLGGVNTFIPTPWVLLRYVPLIEDARAPSRFAVIAAMGCAVLLASALTELRARAPLRRGLVFTATALLLAFELVPMPRRLYSAAVPSIYDIVAADTRPVGVLELPFGLRDGLSSLGNFTAMTQFYQTYHHKPVFGGYLSRISNARKARYRNRAVLGVLMALSEGRAPTPGQLARARAGAAAFLGTSHLGYVVVDGARASPELRALAVELLGLRKIGDSAGRELFIPQSEGGAGMVVANGGLLRTSPRNPPAVSPTGAR